MPQVELQDEVARLRAELTTALTSGGGQHVDVMSVVMGPQPGACLGCRLHLPTLRPMLCGGSPLRPGPRTSCAPPTAGSIAYLIPLGQLLLRPDPPLCAGGIARLIPLNNCQLLRARCPLSLQEAAMEPQQPMLLTVDPHPPAGSDWAGMADGRLSGG